MAEWREKVVKLKKLDGSVEVVSVDRVKPAVLKSSPVRQLKQHQPQVPQAPDQPQVPQTPDQPSVYDRRTHCGHEFDSQRSCKFSFFDSVTAGEVL